MANPPSCHAAMSESVQGSVPRRAIASMPVLTHVSAPADEEAAPLAADDDAAGAAKAQAKTPGVASLFDVPLYDAAKVKKTDKIEKSEQRLQVRSCMLSGQSELRPVIIMIVTRCLRCSYPSQISPWDADAWAALINEVKGQDIDTFRWYAKLSWWHIKHSLRMFNVDCRSYFEKLLRAFPTSGRYWRMYILREIQVRF